jgi:Transglycosylase SLT domain
MRRSLVWGPVTTIVLCALLWVLPRSATADVAKVQNPHFPEPVALTPSVAFWKQVYTEHGVGDFVLHDRDNLGVIYDVVRVSEKTNQARAEQLAKPEIERVRGEYRDMLIRLAEGAAPDELGAQGRRVAEMWGCPCAPDSLRLAAENIRVQQGLREKVDEGLRRARGLMPQIVGILRRHDVPPELAALPLVESTFNPGARSKAGAVGLWQFIRSTGKRYLTITRKRDDRRDPLRATEAAAHLLKNNYNTLGSWPLAIVAYNHGHAGIQAASEAVGSKAIEDIVAHYSGPRFGFASKNFYAEFLAALDVVHPLLSDQGKPLAAKGRRRSVQQASVTAQPQVIIVAPPAPALAPTPVEAAPAIETPASPAPASQAEQPAAPDQTSTSPDVLPPPTFPLTDFVETPAPSEEASLAEQVAAPEQASVTPDVSAPSALPSSDSNAAPPPADDETSLHATTPSEVQEAGPPETASP